MLRFKRNMGSLDRLVRITVGVVLWVLGPLTDIIVTDTLSNILMATVGTLAILSAVTAYCFLYDVTGFGTNR